MAEKENPRPCPEAVPLHRPEVDAAPILPEPQTPPRRPARCKWACPLFPPCKKPGPGAAARLAAAPRPCRSPAGAAVRPAPMGGPGGAAPVGSPPAAGTYYRIMQISPEHPSLMTRSMVSCSFMRASAGMRYSLLCRPSFTSSCSDFPKMLLSHIFAGFSSNSCSR